MSPIGKRCHATALQIERLLQEVFLLEKGGIGLHAVRMITQKLTVTEAAENFSEIVDRSYEHGESTMLLRSGEPVAMVVPVEEKGVTGREWLKMWKKMPHLDPEEAEAFGKDIEEARNNLLPLKSKWD